MTKKTLTRTRPTFHFVLKLNLNQFHKRKEKQIQLSPLHKLLEQKKGRQIINLAFNKFLLSRVGRKQI